MVRVGRFTAVALSFLAGACVMIMYNTVRHGERGFSQKIVLSLSNEILQSGKQTGQDKLLDKIKNDTIKLEELPHCRGQTAYKTLEVPKVHTKIWDEVKFVLLFIGYLRSGHSLLGALLDAHPNIIISEENHVLRTWRTLPNRTKTRDRLFQIIYEKSYWHSLAGARSSVKCYSTLGYKYQVPNQWQGRFNKYIKVIGDKQGPETVRALEFQPNNRHVFPNMKQAIKIPFKFIHVVRNPFDIVATQILRTIPGRLSSEERKKFFQNPYNASKEVQHAIARDHLKLTSGVINLIKRYGDDIITIYSEEMIKNPTKQIRMLCQFLSVSCSNEYMKDCASIVQDGPSKSRYAILWTDAVKNMLTDLISKTPMLQRYKFNEE